MREHGVQSELTRQLAGDAQEEERTGVPPVTPPLEDLAGGRLDDLLDVRDQHAVLPADYSQLRAIQQARSGANLVIHGPPGTGKSQTIANLVATLLADGKRVLFVSEKTAALDVVKRRLEQCGLGSFCLDLHSDRGRKGEVYGQLEASLADERKPIAPPVSLSELIESRDQLNRVVRRLHQRREPLGQSVYQVQGLLAPLRALPRCEQIGVPSATNLDQEWLRETLRRSERIARRSSEFVDHVTSRWLALRTPQSSLQLAELIREDLATIQPAIASLRDVASPHADWLGLSEVSSAGDVDRVIRLLELLHQAPTVPKTWFGRDVVSRLRRLADVQAAQQAHRRRLEQRLGEWFGDELPALDYQAMASATELTSPEQEAIAAAIGPGWHRDLGSDPAALSRSADALAEAARALVLNAEMYGRLLGTLAPGTLAEVEQAASLAKLILDLEPMPERWLHRGETEALGREAAKARSLLDELSQAEDRFQERYSAALIDLVDEAMLIRYRTDHQSGWRRMFGGSFRRDQRILRGQLRTPGKLALSEALAAVEQALEVQNLRQSWSDTSGELTEALGQRFAGRETDWDRVSADLAAARLFRDEWRGEPVVLRELLATEADGRRRRELAELLPHLSEAVDAFMRAGEDLGDGRVISPRLDFGSTEEALAPAAEPLRRLAGSTQAIYERLIKPIASYSQLVDLIESGVQLRPVKEEDEHLAPGLASDFGPHFQQESTDWEGVRRALDWTAQFLDAAGKRPSAVLRRHASEPQPVSEYARRERAARDARQAFRE
ncbi:MAG: AAA domain-containing protein, partial [Chloroflexi bacterium]|nr:AAA domain-containing protein [Chloroflexota bacterium]